MSSAAGEAAGGRTGATSWVATVFHCNLLASIHFFPLYYYLFFLFSALSFDDIPLYFLALIRERSSPIYFNASLTVDLSRTTERKGNKAGESTNVDFLSSKPKQQIF